MVNSLWTSGGGYWSSRNPYTYLPYYNDFDQRGGSLTEYSIANYINNISGGGNQGEAKWSNSRGEYGYWLKTSEGEINYVRPGKYTEGYIGYAVASFNINARWIGINIRSGVWNKPDGMVYSFSFDFAFGGGAGFEIGLVTDKNGGRQWIASGNANIGYGISAGPNIRSIQSMPGSTFKATDYLGYSSGFSVGLFDVGGFFGGNKPQWNFTNFMDFGDTYIENGLGISKIKAPIFGAWWSNTSTKKLFGR